MMEKINTTRFKKTEIGLIPEEWGFDSLGNHCKILGGKRLPKEDSLTNQRTDHPYIRITDLGDFGVNESGLKYISDETHAKIRKYIIESGDIYISNVGTIGLVGLVKDNLFGANLTENAVRLTKLNGLNNFFLGYYLKSESGQNQIRQNTVGAVQPKLPIYGVENIKLPIPELTEQNEIAEVLSSLYEKIELNRKINANLEKLASTLFKKWFFDIKLSEKLEITNFTDLVEIMSGGTPKTNENQYWNGDVSFFTPKDAKDTAYTLQTEKNITQIGLDSCNSPLYPVDTTFITARGTVGKVAMAGVPMAMNQSCYALKGKKGIGAYFVYELTKRTAEELKQKAHGSVFSTITIPTFSQVSFPLPDLELIKKYELVVNPVFETIKANSRENMRLTLVRDSLLPRLMSGKIRVKI